jgi:hypothetical protein
MIIKITFFLSVKKQIKMKTEQITVRKINKTKPAIINKLDVLSFEFNKMIKV